MQGTLNDVYGAIIYARSTRVRESLSQAEGAKLKGDVFLTLHSPTAVGRRPLRVQPTSVAVVAASGHSPQCPVR